MVHSCDAHFRDRQTDTVDLAFLLPWGTKSFPPPEGPRLHPRFGGELQTEAGSPTFTVILGDHLPGMLAHRVGPRKEGRPCLRSSAQAQGVLNTHLGC